MSNDVFDSCFDALQHSLASLVSNNPGVVKLSKTNIKDTIFLRRRLEDDIQSEVRDKLLTAASVRLASIRTQREISLARMKSDLDSKRADLTAMRTFYQKELESCMSHKLLSERRLSTQMLTAERRIRELVFEILGEYGKSEIRFRRRQDYLSYTARIHAAWMCHKNVWDRFALRLCYEATRTSSSEDEKQTNNSSAKATPSQTSQPQYDSLRGVVLDSFTDADEIAGVEERVAQELSSRHNEAHELAPLRAVTIVRFLKGRLTAGSGSAISKNSFRAAAPIIVDTIHDLWRILSALRAWALRAQRSVPAPSSKDARLNLAKSHTGKTGTSSKGSSISSKELRPKKIIPDFLQSQYIDWLHPPSHYPNIWDRLSTARIKSAPLRVASSKVNDTVPSAPPAAGISGETRNVLTTELESFIGRYSIQQSAFIASERLYYCLEERQAAGVPSPGRSGVRDASDEFHTMLRQIETHYVKNADAGLLPLREQLHRSPMAVDEYLGSHRSLSFSKNPIEDISSLGSCYPDVIRIRVRDDNAAEKSLHFIAATTFNLFETQAFVDIVSKNPPDSQRLRKMSSRGVSPPGVFTTETDPDMSFHENLSATEAENAIKYSLNTDRVASLGRLYSLVRVAGDVARNIDNIPPASNKAASQRERARKGRRNASNRKNSVGRRRKNSNSAATVGEGADDSHEDEDETDLLETDATYDRRDQPSQPQREESELTIFPLSDLCMRELLRSEFWPDEDFHDALLPVPAVDGEDPGSRSDCPAVSCASFINLLPDRVRQCLDPIITLPSEGKTRAQNLAHKYVLVSDEFHATQECDASDGARPQPRQCFYLVQLRNADNAGTVTAIGDLSPTAGENVGNNALREEEGKHLAHILNARRTGFGLPSSSTPSQSDRTNISGRTTPRKTKDLSSDSVTPVEDDDQSKSKRKNWDPTVLSTVCRWRSCLAECAESSPKYLCAYHTSLYMFLEGNSKNGSGEAAKYLPKRAPLLMSSNTLTDGRKDLLMIRAASTLLQELWDGKLKATMRSFTKKVNYDMGLRSRLESSLSLTSAAWASRDGKEVRSGAKSREKAKDPGDTLGNSVTKKFISAEEIEQSLYVPAVPSWAVWKDEESLKRTIEGQSTCCVAMEGVLNTETAISDELKRMLDLHIFPAQELTVIKKEVKAFKDGFDNAINYEASMPYSAVYYENTAALSGKGAATKITEDYVAMLAAESKLGDRKLSMLRNRRLDEQDNRQANARRVARVRAIEESQAKDPANFSRQRF
jgi:hypothetical protein